MENQEEIINKLIAEYKQLFRILKDWEIKFEDDNHYYDQCCSNKNKKAVIYPVSMETNMSDYVYHELLHICQADLRRGSHSERREKEELFVMDLCKIFEKYVVIS
jgi:hypothetical protein